MGRNGRLFAVALSLLGGFASAAMPVYAQDPAVVATYFDRLREQGLFSLAERYGLDRRAELPRDSAESVQLAVELSRTFAHHARAAATTDEHGFLQARANESLDDYQGDEPFPRIEAVNLERSYRAIDRAEHAWWLSTADPEDLDARNAASKRLADARAALEAWIDSAGDSRVKPVSSRRPEDLTRRELAVLIHGARLKSIDIILLTAEFAPNRFERERLVRQAEDSMKRLTGSAERGTSAALRGYTVRIARLIGDEVALRREVRLASADRMPPGLRQDAIAELARFELDQGHFEAAARLLVESKATLGAINDRLRALHVEAVLGMARNAGMQGAELLATAEAELAKVAGPWRLRSDYLLEETRQIQKFGDSAAALVRRGNREFRSGARDEAISTFRQAAESAATRSARAELRFMTASLLVEAQRFQQAITECELVVNDAPDEQVAARASLLTAYCYGRIAAQSRSVADQDQYRQMLQRHLDAFPQDETAGDASWMLGALAAQQGELGGIVDADRRMPETHPRAAESMERAVRAVLQAQESMRSTDAEAHDGRDSSAWDSDAKRLASRLLATAGKDLPGAQRTLSAARLLAGVSNPSFEAVLGILNQVPRPTPAEASSEDWQQISNDAAALRLVCQTATGQFADAATTLELLRSISIAELLDVLKKLSIAGKQLAGPQRSELARLELTTIARIRLQARNLTADERQLLAECEAEALFASGQYGEAVRMFEEAVGGQPALAPRLAEALERTGQQADLARAQKIWRQQVALHRQGTNPWFQAQFRLGRNLLALGQTAEYQNLIRTARILYPELGGPDLKRAFDELDRQAASGGTR